MESMPAKMNEEEVKTVAVALESKEAEHILQWAANKFPRLVISSSLV